MVSLATRQTFTMPPELDARVREYCDSRDLKISQLIRKGLEMAMREENAK